MQLVASSSSHARTADRENKDEAGHWVVKGTTSVWCRSVRLKIVVAEAGATCGDHAASSVGGADLKATGKRRRGDRDVDEADGSEEADSVEEASSSVEKKGTSSDDGDAATTLLVSSHTLTSLSTLKRLWGAS